jgi:hypothetical protein
MRRHGLAGCRKSPRDVIASDRRERGDLSCSMERRDCFVASLLAMTSSRTFFDRLQDCFVALGITICMTFPVWAVEQAGTPGQGKAIQDEMVEQIQGRYKGRFLVKKILAPVTMNLEKLQDFPEDPSQKILLEPLPISQAYEFNYRSEVKGHLPFYPWIPALPEPPFLRMPVPVIKKEAQPASWMFEVLNPQGQTIFRQRGTNSLPEELIWEGKDSEKKFAVVDRLYSAQLTLIGADEKATVIQGDSVLLPSMIYGSEESETIEFALNRLFIKDTADMTPEGAVMLAKIAERLRERGLQKLHVRIASSQPALAEQREKSLTAALEKMMLFSPGQIEHDHAEPTLRGEIVAFWIKKEAGK